MSVPNGTGEVEVLPSSIYFNSFSENLATASILLRPPVLKLCPLPSPSTTPIFSFYSGLVVASPRS